MLRNAATENHDVRVQPLTQAVYFQRNDTFLRDMLAAAQSFIRGRETDSIPTRGQCISRLSSTTEFDVLIIGGGSTGAGAALDATTRSSLHSHADVDCE